MLIPSLPALLLQPKFWRIAGYVALAAILSGTALKCRADLKEQGRIEELLRQNEAQLVEKDSIIAERTAVIADIRARQDSLARERDELAPALDTVTVYNDATAAQLDSAVAAIEDSTIQARVSTGLDSLRKELALTRQDRDLATSERNEAKDEAAEWEKLFNLEKASHRQTIRTMQEILRKPEKRISVGFMAGLMTVWDDGLRTGPGVGVGLNIRAF